MEKLKFETKGKKKAELIKIIEEFEELRNYFNMHLSLIDDSKKYFKYTVVKGLDQNFMETEELIFIEKSKFQIICMWIKELFNKPKIYKIKNGIKKI